MADYELWFADDLGNRLAYINDCQSFEYVKTLGDIGYGTFSFPQNSQIYDNQIPDRRILVYRRNTNGSLSLDFTWLLRRFSYNTTIQGQTNIHLAGFDLNSLLDRRIIAYYAASSESSKADFADDMMKEIVTENLLTNADYSGTPTTYNRDISSYGFSVERDLGIGPSIDKGFAWRNVLKVLQDIQATSKQLDNEVFFGFVPTSEKTAEFRTWLGNGDRTLATGVNPVVFSLAWGNLIEPRLTYDFTEENNLVYGGGRGNEDARTIATAYDEGRAVLSRLGHNEAFYNASISDDSNIVEDAANQQLGLQRPKNILIGTLLDTPLTPYGGLQGWQLGNKVTINYVGKQFNVIIRSISVRVNDNGKEIIRSRIEEVV